MSIDFRERGRERKGVESERNNDVRETCFDCLPYMLWPWMEPATDLRADQESNPQQYGPPTNCTTWPGLVLLFLTLLWAPRAASLSVVLD